MKFLLIDDHALFRQGLLQLLARLPGDNQFAEAETCEAAFALADADIGLILLDLALPGINGLDGLTRLREICPQTPIVLLSANESPQVIVDGMRRGARGFIPKSSTPDVMLAALQVVLAGGTYVPASGVVGRPPEPEDSRALTARQLEVLDLVAQNLSNKEIANALGMRVNTVRVHLAAIFRALGVYNRNDAARAAIDLRTGKNE